MAIMKTVVLLTLLAVVWADSTVPHSPDAASKDKEKRTAGSKDSLATPGIKYALPHQQSPSLPAQIHAQYIPQQQQQQPQQQQQQVYSTIPQQYLQQTYQPQYNLQYQQAFIPQQQAYVAPQQNQIRYQFVPKGQTAEIQSAQSQQQYIFPQHQQQGLSFAQPQAYLLPQAQPQQYFPGGLGSAYLLPGHQQQIQPVIMLAVPAQQYDAGLLGLYNGGAGQGGRALNYLIQPQQQQNLLQQQLATYLLAQQQQQPPHGATINTVRTAGSQASSSPGPQRLPQHYKS